MATVLLHPDVEKHLQSLPNDIEDRVRSKLAEAGENPDRHLKPLSGRDDYSLRIGNVSHAEYDSPYGAVEAGGGDGPEPGTAAYDRQVARMKAMWLSRRDFAHQVDCCLRDESVTFDVFYGVSDNRTRWFDLEHARSVIGYDPQDDGSEWTGPGTESGEQG